MKSPRAPAKPKASAEGPAAPERGAPRLIAAPALPSPSRSAGDAPPGSLLRPGLVAELLAPGVDDLGADLLLPVVAPVDGDELRPRGVERARDLPGGEVAV